MNRASHVYINNQGSDFHIAFFTLQGVTKSLLFGEGGEAKVKSIARF